MLSELIDLLLLVHFKLKKVDIKFSKWCTGYITYSLNIFFKSFQTAMFKSDAGDCVKSDLSR